MLCHHLLFKHWTPLALYAHVGYKKLKLLAPYYIYHALKLVLRNCPHIIITVLVDFMGEGIEVVNNCN